MKGLEMWHVFLDEKTGHRSCCHGDLDAFTFNLEGELQAACDGKTELPAGEWTGEELCEITAGCMKEAGMHRLSSLPGIIRQAVKDCGGARTDKDRRDARIPGETAGGRH